LLSQVIDYRKPENYTVDFFVLHKRVKKKNKVEYELLTRWKGYDSGDDTWQPLKEKANECPDLVKAYLKDNPETTKEMVVYITRNARHYKDLI